MQLDPGQRVVLELAARGLITTEVADHLGLAPDHVKRCFAEAIAALGARSKLEAVVLALRLGLIDPPGASAPTQPPAPYGRSLLRAGEDRERSQHDEPDEPEDLVAHDGARRDGQQAGDVAR